MTLKNQFEHSGNWLFQWRSYLPLVLIALLLPSLRSFAFFDGGRTLDNLWEVFCLAVSVLGLCIRAWTVGHAPRGTSGRNTHKQIASQLSTEGMYSVVRHPVYLGNFFVWLGLSLFTHVWWATAIFVLAFWLYYERIMFAEEAFLEKKFGAEYVEWASRTPAFVPRLRNWKPYSLPFSVRTVLRRECSSVLGVAATFLAIDLVGDFCILGRIDIDRMWVGFFVGSGLLYLVLRFLKRRTGLLQVAGR